MEIISRSEARNAERKTYYTGKLCKYKHDAERYVSSGACVGCDHTTPEKREGDRIQAEALQLAKRKALIDAESNAVHGQVSRAVAYATKKVFERLEAPPASPDAPVPFTPNFRWNPTLRDQFIERYIDTGDIAEARAHVGVSPSAYHKELTTNEKFAKAVEDAQPLAEKHLEERAIQLALKGNDKLLTAVLKAKNPNYRDSVRVDLNAKVSSISDEELDRRLKRALDAGVIVSIPRPKAGRPRLNRGEATPDSAEQDCNAISG
jgi:hypothetical protein